MNNYLPTDYQAFIHTSRYARWLEEDGRRESWSETVDRYITGIVEKWTTPTIRDEIRDAILSLEVMPSMRAIDDSSGPAFVTGQHCRLQLLAYLPVDDPEVFR